MKSWFHTSLKKIPERLPSSEYEARWDCIFGWLCRNLLPPTPMPGQQFSFPSSPFQAIHKCWSAWHTQHGVKMRRHLWRGITTVSSDHQLYHPPKYTPPLHILRWIDDIFLSLTQSVNLNIWKIIFNDLNYILIILSIFVCSAKKRLTRSVQHAPSHQRGRRHHQQQWTGCGWTANIIPLHTHTHTHTLLP